MTRAAQHIYTSCLALGVVLRRDGDLLAWDAPAHVDMNEARVARIREHKADLLALADRVDCRDWQVRRDQRGGVRVDASCVVPVAVALAVYEAECQREKAVSL